jgi:hypothetical protein
MLGDVAIWSIQSKKLILCDMAQPGVARDLHGPTRRTYMGQRSTRSIRAPVSTLSLHELSSI